MTIRQRFLPIFLTLLLTLTAFAQTSAPTTPATAPATSQRARYELVVPQGMIIVIVGDRKALCDPADEPWVKQVLTEVGPATRPTTMPTDLLGTLSSKRAELVQTITTDLALPDAKPVNAFIDEHVIPTIQRFVNFKPAIFYLPVTRQKLLAVVKAGWQNPQLYYNRAAEDVAINQNIAMSIDRPMDDALVPVLANQDVSVDLRKQQLKQQVQQLESEMINRVAGQADLSLQGEFARMIEQLAMAPLALKPGTEWFGLGVTGVLSGKYLAMISGLPREALQNAMSAQDPRNPMRPQTIDLLHLTPPNQLNPQYVGAYLDAMRRKSVAVVGEWIKQAGEAAIPKTLSAIAQQKPPDGEAMIKIIKDASGQDLSAAVKAQ